MKDGSEGLNKILTSDVSGYATWTTTTYAATQSFTASSPLTITHNLNNTFYMIQLWNYVTGEELFGGYSNRNANSVMITLSEYVPNCGVIIKS